MTIIEVYSRQYRWRSWPTVIDSLPSLEGQLVLDLGCGIGDLAADLSARGARIIGVDIDKQVIDYANKRNLLNAEFRQSDSRAFCEPYLHVDGIWSSFTAAYSQRHPTRLRSGSNFCDLAAG